MLFEKYTDKIYNHLLPIELIRPYPSVDKREEWNHISKEIQNILKARANEYSNYIPSPLTASMLIKCVDSGNSVKIKKLFNEKINALISVVLAECALDNGEYMDYVLDISWSLMDMAIWYLPTPQKLIAGKLHTGKNEFDQMSAQISNALTYTYYLLKPKFDEIDINIGIRFKYEIEKRVFKTYLEESKNWMKNESGHYYQWVPDCLSSIIFAFMIFETDYKIRHAVIEESLIVIDEILENEIRGGNEDKTVVYRGLIKYFDILYMITGSAFDAFTDFPCDDLLKTAIECDGHNKDTVISFLEHIFYTNNNQLLSKAYSEKTNDFHMEYIAKSLSIDKLLFTIFNSDLIENMFNTEKKGL